MTKRKTKDEKDYDILSEMYRRAYAASTPIGDFDAMVQNASLNEFGQKVIPFLKYECEYEIMDQIVVDVLKEYKVPKRRHELFRNSFMLGCSPKTKQPLK